jgi:lysophospholipase L1-like esterase
LTRWDAFNGWSLSQEILTPGQIAYLDAHDEFVVTSIDGPRPGSIITATPPEIVTRSDFFEVQSDLNVLINDHNANPLTNGDADLAAVLQPAAGRGKVWAIGDSLTTGTDGGLNYDAALYSTQFGHPAVWYQSHTWQAWALMASDARWTFGGSWGTGGYSAAQILATHVPSVLAAADPGDTVVVLAGTNGNVLADVKTIHATLRAAGLRTIACTIPPSSASTLSSVAAFNSGLKDYAADNGIVVADIHAAVVDHDTGSYQSAYDDGAGIHPSEAGYRQFGYTIAAALAHVFPDSRPSSLVDHNATFTGSLQTKPLALGSPGNADYGLLAGIGTGTFGPAANSNFRGGFGYKLTRGDTDMNAVLTNPMTLAAGHRMRVGMALEAVPAGSGTWGFRLESSTTGVKIPFALGYGTAFSLGQEAGRFYTDFTVPTLPDYDYRLRINVTGNGSTLHLGEVTMFDLTAMGLA